MATRPVASCGVAAIMAGAAADHVAVRKPAGHVENAQCVPTRLRYLANEDTEHE